MSDGYAGVSKIMKTGGIEKSVVLKKHDTLSRWKILRQILVKI